MASDRIAEALRTLTPEQQDAVWKFIQLLTRSDISALAQSPFLQAADEFIAQHPELLRRLAQ